VGVADQNTITIGKTVIGPGERRTIDLPISLLSDHTPITLTVCVVNGRRPGPRLFVNAAIHGDEVNGVETVRRLARHRSLDRLTGTLIMVPIVNVFGFITHTRYLPDRRDLNRSFPGSANGSPAGQLAHLFLNEVVANCTHGIDLHTGAIHRSNMPQVRADLSNPEVAELARAFGVPLILNAANRPGSLRKAAMDRGIPVLVFEGGEALRFDEIAISAALRGVLSVMSSLGMIRHGRRDNREFKPIIARSSTWVRAPRSGVLRTTCSLGDVVEEGQELANIADPYGVTDVPVLASTHGVIIGQSSLPVVNQGDGIFHLGRVADAGEAMDAVESFYEDWEQELSGT
jgi:predicted deacylase